MALSLPVLSLPTGWTVLAMVVALAVAAAMALTGLYNS